MTEKKWIRAVCQECGSRFKPLPREYEGRKGRCPRCNNLVILTDARREKIRLACPGCGVGFKPISGKKRGLRTRCPACECLFVIDEPSLLVEAEPSPPDPEVTQIATQEDRDVLTDPEATYPASPFQSKTDDAEETVLADSSPGAKESAGDQDTETETQDLAQLDAALGWVDVPLVWTPGEVILNTYRVEGILGQGGFGTVYKVHHLEWDLDLAVKTPNPEALDAHGAEIFTSEAETWSGLGLHPHIVSCHYVRNLGGVPRVFAEFVEGGSLQELIEKGEVRDTGRILDIAIQFAWGLAYAHGQGLVHKDVKPANVMLTLDGRAKVTDFGLTRAKGRFEPGEVTAGGESTVFVDGNGCTPAYAAPEQLAGSPVSRAADAWSFGVSLLAIFTGGARWRVGAAAPAILEELPTATDETNKPAMPESLAALLRELFAVEPEARPRDMDRVAARLLEIYEAETGLNYPRRPPVQDSGRNADSLVNRGLSLLDLNSRDEAAALFRQALALEPHHPEATYNLGLVRWRAGEISDMDLVHDLEELRSSHTAAWNDELALGLVHLERGDHESALTVLEAIEDEAGRQNPRVQTALTTAQSCLAKSRPRTVDWGNWIQKRKTIHKQVVFSGDTKRVILPFEKKAFAEVFDTASGQCLQRLEGHESDVLSVALNQDGSLALTGGADMQIKVWEVDSGRCLMSLAGHEKRKRDNQNNGVNTLCFVDAGHKILSGGEDATIREWDATSGKCLRVLESRHRIHCMDVLDEKNLLATGSIREISIWDLVSGKCLHILSAGAHILSLRFSPDGRHLLAGCNSGLLLLFDLEDGRKCLEREAGRWQIMSLAFNRDGALAVSGGKRSFVKLWDRPTGRCRRTFSFPTVDGGRSDVYGIFCSSEDADVVYSLSQFAGIVSLTRHPYLPRPAPWLLCQITASEAVSRARQEYEACLRKADQALQNLDYAASLGSLERARQQPGHARAPRGLALAGSLAMRLPRRTLAGGWQSLHIEAHGTWIKALAIAPDGSSLLSGSQYKSHANDSILKQWDPHSGECVRDFPDTKKIGNAAHILFSPDGRQFIVYCLSRRLYFIETESGKLVDELDTKDPLYNLAMSADGRLLYGGCKDNEDGNHHIRVWDVASRMVLLSRPLSGRLIWGLGASPDCLYLAASDDSGKLIVQDLTGRLETLEHASLKPRPETKLFFSPAAEALLYAGGGSTARIDLTTGSLESSPTGPISSRPIDQPHAAVTPDGHTMLVTGRTEVTAWDMRSMSLLRTFEGHQERITALALDPTGRWFASGDESGRIRIWTLDWELEEKSPADWDDAAEPYLRHFLTSQRPRAGTLPQDREPTETERRALCAPTGRPTWSEEDFHGLLFELQCAGLGWIRPEGLRRKLQNMVDKGDWTTS
ncbi:MAG: protein kinase [Desulfohalobiaceae bacterium]|nr:protein kinase [Desulfohalobiaceae bacterium]